MTASSNQSSQGKESLPKNALPPGVTVKDGRYYITPTINGKRKWIGLSRVDRGIEALHAELDKQFPDRPPTSVAALLQRFAREGQGHRRDSTWAKYCQTIHSEDSKLVAYFGRMRIDAVNQSHVAKYLEHRVKQGHGPVGNRDIAVLASAYNYAQRQGWIIVKPTVGVRRNHETPSRERVSHKELQEVVDALAVHTANFVAMLYLTGFRMGDLFELKWEQLEKEGIHIIESKNLVDHLKGYSETLRWFLERAKTHSEACAKRHKRDVSPYVFTNRYGRQLTYDGLRSAFKIVGKGFAPFKLRHLRSLAESDQPGTLGHAGAMVRVYRRSVKTKPVK